MLIGVATSVYRDVNVNDALARVKSVGADAVELGTGGWPGSEHADPQRLLSDARAFDNLCEALREYDLVVSALSVHDNPLHPIQERAATAQESWLGTLRLAERLEVGTVNVLSGCPGDGAPEARVPNWIATGWPDEFAELLERQWVDHLVPYWSREVERARAHGVRVAFELLPGFMVYNPMTFLQLRDAVGDIAVNLDPSHLWWQGIDPVAAIELLGGAIVHVHAKDTQLVADEIRRNGVFDLRPPEQTDVRSWNSCLLGRGHDRDEWQDIVRALRGVEYNGVLSLEHEDIGVAADEGVREGVMFLRSLLDEGVTDAPR
jgi:sugar phosphate isomerase/epimerase